MKSDKHRHEIVQGISVSRRNLFEIAFTAIVLGIGVNLIGGYITITVSPPWISLTIGIVLCVISLLYLAGRLLARRNINSTYKGFLVYDGKNNTLVNIPRYEFGEEIYMYMRNAFSENRALKTQWDKESLKCQSEDDMAWTNTGGVTAAAELVSEATEYFILAKLSTCLTDYFSDECFRQKNLFTYNRDDIPSVLLSNRFLEIFSRPMKDRPAFVGEMFKKNTSNGEIVASYSAAGARYERFDLTLPKGSVVRRISDNKIEIKTKKFVLSITVRFEGFNTLLPSKFHKYYLGINHYLNHISDYEIPVDIRISTKLGSLFSITGWQYYHWIDSFLRDIDEDLSEDVFFNRLGWESALTVLECLKTKKSKGRVTRAPSKKATTKNAGLLVGSVGSVRPSPSVKAGSASTI